jgi:hypothetical protein
VAQSAVARPAREARTLTDRDRLAAAIAEFRRLGWWARAGQQDGWKAVPEDALRRGRSVVFWHVNETDVAFDAAGNLRAPLHLRHFVDDADQVGAVLDRYGLSVAVDHSANGGVMALPRILPALTAVPGPPVSAVGTRYRGILLAGDETLQPLDLIVAAATAQEVQLVADAQPGLSATVPAALFTQAVAEGVLTIVE